MVEAATTLRPDVIVADITMPLLNGIEALEELRKDGLDIPVVFLTMHRESSTPPSRWRPERRAMSSSMRPRRNWCRRCASPSKAERS